MSEIQLRPWQADCTAKALRWMCGSQEKHFLINAAPGSGKTICASVIAKKLIEEGKIDRVVVIAPRKTVVEQWASDFKFVTGRKMQKVTAADEDAEDYGVDLAATWAAVQGLLDGFQAICRSSKTLVICDEHHHAAVEAAWGAGANGAFSDAENVLVLTGTPIRSDGKESVWLAYDDHGQIDQPPDGMYTLSYGEAVDLEYCRPVTFHRHEGKFSVQLEDGEKIDVSGSEETNLTPQLRRIRGLQQALDYYKLACTPRWVADGIPDLHSYQASMLDWAISKLNDMRMRMPEAGGLVIAPSIEVAEYMALLLEELDGEKPMVVHSQNANSDGKISSFRNNKKRWIVSVAMVSEGVDIPRLRVLVYLPNAQTELAFRQAIGRVVRNAMPNDDTRAYVIMPTHKIFEEFARRVEREMPPRLRPGEQRPTTKICPTCGEENAKEAETCKNCDEPFPVPQSRMKVCSNCEGLNPPGSKECQHCEVAFGHNFTISLTDALRTGAIIRGMDLDEGEVQEGEAVAGGLREAVLKSGDENLIRMIRLLPEESYGRLLRVTDEAKSKPK